MTFTGKRRWEDDAHPHEAPPVMTSPMVILAIGSLGAGGFLMISNRLIDFLRPVTGTPPLSHGFFSPLSWLTLALGRRVGRVRVARLRPARGAG